MARQPSELVSSVQADEELEMTVAIATLFLGRNQSH
jgi:hypothetical protein